MLIESAKPVANVNSSNATTVNRSDTGEATAMRYRCGVKSSDVMVVILVTSQRPLARFMNIR